MNPNNPTPDELQSRIRQLESELAHVRTERDWCLVMLVPQGERLADIIAEYEKELGDRS